VTYVLTALSPEKEAYKNLLQLSPSARPTTCTHTSPNLIPRRLAFTGIFAGVLGTQRPWVSCDDAIDAGDQPASPARSQEQNELMGIQSERSRQENQPKRTQPLPTYRPPPTAVDRSSSENLVQTIRPRLLSGRVDRSAGENDRLTSLFLWRDLGRDGIGGLVASR
jgi:hypothetical protein